MLNGYQRYISNQKLSKYWPILLSPLEVDTSFSRRVSFYGVFFSVSVTNYKEKIWMKFVHTLLG